MSIEREIVTKLRESRMNESASGVFRVNYSSNGVFSAVLVRAATEKEAERIFQEKKPGYSIITVSSIHPNEANSLQKRGMSIFESEDCDTYDEAPGEENIEYQEEDSIELQERQGIDLKNAKKKTPLKYNGKLVATLYLINNKNIIVTHPYEDAYEIGEKDLSWLMDRLNTPKFKLGDIKAVSQRVYLESEEVEDSTEEEVLEENTEANVGASAKRVLNKYENILVEIQTLKRGSGYCASSTISKELTDSDYKKRYFANQTVLDKLDDIESLIKSIRDIVAKAKE